MFEPKQIIEGKIFIHQRWGEALQHSWNSFPASYFECFTQSFLLTLFFPLLLPIFISNPIKP